MNNGLKAALAVIGMLLATPVLAQPAAPSVDCATETREFIQMLPADFTPSAIRLSLESASRENSVPLLNVAASLVIGAGDEGVPITGDCKAHHTIGIMEHVGLPRPSMDLAIAAIASIEQSRARPTVAERAPTNAVPEPFVQPAAPTESSAVAQAQPEAVAPVQIAPVRTAIVRYQAQPAAERDPITDARIPGMLERLTAAEALLNQLPKDADGNIDLSQLTPAQQVEAVATVEQVRAEVAEVETFVGQYIDRGILDWMTVGYAPVILLIILFGFLGYRRLNQRIDTKATGETVDLLNTKVVAVQADVADLKSRHKHDVQKIAEGDERTLRPADLKALVDGAGFTYRVLVDGEVKSFSGNIVQHTGSGDAFVKLDVLSKPVTGKALFGALATYIESDEGQALAAVNS